MPQVFQVLKCYKCSIFQIHLTKKSNKWECKICGEKQSMKRHYGIGTAAECRCHVQKLNAMQGDKNEMLTKSKEFKSDDEDFEDIPKERKQSYKKRKSKWSAFINENDGGTSEEENEPDSHVQDFKKQKQELNNREVMRHRGIEPKFGTSKTNEKKNDTQKLGMSSNKWSAFVSDEDQCSTSLKNSVQVPNKYEIEDYHKPTFSNIKTNDKKYQRQECNIKPNKWSAFISDHDDYFNRNNNVGAEVSNTRICDPYDRKTSINEYQKTISSHRVNESNSQTQKPQYHDSSNKWSPFMSDNENVKNNNNNTMYNFSNINQTYKDLQTDKFLYDLVTNEDSKENQDNFLESTKDLIEIEKDVLKCEKKSLFSLCDDNDLDSILDL